MSRPAMIQNAGGQNAASETAEGRSQDRIRRHPDRRRLTWVASAMLVAFIGWGATPASAQSADDDPALFDAGQAIYQGGCAGCHGDDGMGSDTGRSLIGIAAQQPDRLVHVTSVTDGKGGMPALGERLSPEDIDAAVTYVRLAFVQEDEMNELPRTGASDWIIGLGITLLVVGAIAVRYEHREHLAS